MAFELEQHTPVEALPCPAVYVDDRGVILAANARFKRLWASSRGGEGSLAGHALFRIFADDEREGAQQALSLRATPRPRIYTVKLAASPVRVLMELVPIHEDPASSTVWLIMMRPADVNAGERRAIGDALAAGLFHDLRGPIQVVLGWASLLKRKQVDAARLEHALTMIERNARLELELLQDLLELSRPSWARPPLRREPVNLPELATLVVRGLEPVADERGLRLLLAIDSPTMIVNGHDAYLRRIVANLVSNALKFTPRGGTVECRLSWAEAYVRIVISDSGRGIRREFLPRVFEPFLQERASDPGNPEGVGLGLCVVRHLVELHGGHVTAESSGIGQGATFTVLLPAVSHFAAAEALPSSTPEAC